MRAKGKSAPGAELAKRLRARRAEIEQAVRTRIYAISNPGEAADPSYAEGLRAAVAAALEYGLEGIERRGERPPQVPTGLLAQARLAARNAISLDTVLRRYFAGYTILGDFLVEEGAGLLEDADLKRLLRAQAVLFDRLLAAVSEEYSREDAGRLESSEQRRAESVQRLLDGELLDSSGLAAELAYGFDAFHVALIATGQGATDAVRDLAASLDRLLLLVPRDEQVAWAWLGGRRPLDPAALERLTRSSLPVNVSLSIGEPASGLAGWRLTHRQANAALTVIQSSGERVVRYASVAVLASVLQDDLLRTSLHQLYRAPLEVGRDGGKVARETLRAYFAADRNVSSAAAALGVSRRTVTRRLRTVEDRLGRSLDAIPLELEIALRLDQLEGDSAQRRPV